MTTRIARRLAGRRRESERLLEATLATSLAQEGSMLLAAPDPAR